MCLRQRIINRQRLLRGRTRFTIDRARPGMLYAALARARIPSARIVRIDTSVARRMPGVRAVLTEDGVRFSEPERRVAPGQVVACYLGDVVVGSGGAR